jgi:hypothetical protein
MGSDSATLSYALVSSEITRFTARNRLWQLRNANVAHDAQAGTAGVV